MTRQKRYQWFYRDGDHLKPVLGWGLDVSIEDAEADMPTHHSGRAMDVIYEDLILLPVYVRV